MKREFLAAVVLFLSSFLVYLNSIDNPYIWDDKIQILDNHHLDDYSIVSKFLKKDYYHLTQEESFRPLDTLSLIFIHKLFGRSHKAQRIVNILLHAVVTILIFFIFRDILSFGARLFAGLLFAVHPIHTEAINCVSYRDEILYTLFLILSFVAFLKKKYALTLLLHFIALISKEIAVVFPALLFVYEFIFGDVKKLIKNPYFLGLVGLTVLYVGSRLVFLSNPESFGEYAGGSKLINYLTMPPVLLNYFKLLLVPYPLAVSNSLPLITSPLNIKFIGFLILTFISIWAFVKYYRRFQWEAFFFVSIIVSLLPVLNLIPFLNISLLFEKYLYLNSIAMVALVALLNSRLPKKIQLVLPLIFITSYSYGTWERNKDWSSSKRLIEKNISLYPKNYTLYVFLGEDIMKEGNIKKAIQTFQKGLSIDRNYAPAHNALGVAYHRDGKTELALKSFNRAIELKPTYETAKRNYALVTFQSGDHEKALNFVNTEYGDTVYKQWTHQTRMLFLTMKGQHKDVLDQAEKTKKAGLTWPGFHNQVGVAYFHLGKRIKAKQQFQLELREHPDNQEAKTNLENISRHGF